MPLARMQVGAWPVIKSEDVMQVFEKFAAMSARSMLRRRKEGPKGGICAEQARRSPCHTARPISGVAGVKGEKPTEGTQISAPGPSDPPPSHVGPHGTAVRRLQPSHARSYADRGQNRGHARLRQICQPGLVPRSRLIVLDRRCVTPPRQGTKQGIECVLGHPPAVKRSRKCFEHCSIAPGVF